MMSNGAGEGLIGPAVENHDGRPSCGSATSTEAGSRPRKRFVRVTRTLTDFYEVDEDRVRRFFAGEATDEQITRKVEEYVYDGDFDALESIVGDDSRIYDDRQEAHAEAEVVEYCRVHAAEHPRAQIDKRRECWWCTSERLARERPQRFAIGERVRQVFAGWEGIVIQVRADGLFLCSIPDADPRAAKAYELASLDHGSERAIPAPSRDPLPHPGSPAANPGEANQSIPENTNVQADSGASDA